MKVLRAIQIQHTVVNSTKSEPSSATYYLKIVLVKLTVPQFFSFVKQR